MSSDRTPRLYALRSGEEVVELCLGCALRHRPLVMRSLKVALVVGTILNVGNQGEALWSDASIDVWKAAFTYAVPYMVATYGALSNARVPS